MTSNVSRSTETGETAYPPPGADPHRDETSDEHLRPGGIHRHRQTRVVVEGSLSVRRERLQTHHRVLRAPEPAEVVPAENKPPRGEVRVRQVAALDQR
jgi:hypothetical protein